jgi:hypothetical protein
LVEHFLAKEDVARSSRVTRSPPLLKGGCAGWSRFDHGSQIPFAGAWFCDVVQSLAARGDRTAEQPRRGPAKMKVRSAPRRPYHPRHMKTLVPLSVSLLACLSFAFGEEKSSSKDFTPLFDGKTLDGWEQHSGKAEYRVEDGAIVGKTVAGTGNSFLCTKKTYGDFILEVEFKVDPSMNSGIQFRSAYYPQDTEMMIDGKKVKFAADRVHGYQFEIDPSSRAYTGGVYDEARRGWLFDLKNNEEARKAFKQGEWNQARIECRGDSIKTFINNVPAADLKDALTKEGLIALQVHGIGKNGTPGKEIRWRNIRIKELK